DPVYPATNAAQPSSVQALFLVPDKALWLVGDRGTVVRYRVSPLGLSQGEVIPLDSQGSLLAAWGYDDQLWTVGRKGTILHFDGSNGQTEYSGTTASMTAIFGLSPTDIWAAGESGTVLHFDGTTWSRRSLGRYSGTLTSIWGASSDDVWIGGEDAM